MQPRKTFFIGVVVLIWWASSSNAAIKTLTGREDDLWGHGEKFLIIAHVVDVRALEKAPNDSATHLLTLEPIFTLAGDFDPSRQAQFQARVVVGGFGSWISEIPARGSTVLVLITPGNIGGDDTRPFPCVASDICNFMPDESGLVILHGFDDKRILETMARIREARGADKNTTRPADAKSGK